MNEKTTIGISHAWNGLVWAFRKQLNFRIHILAVAVVVIAGVTISLSTVEWFALCCAFACVLIAELFNTALEELGNAVTQEHNEFIKHAKDVSAGAVLVSALFSLIVAFIVFYP